MKGLKINHSYIYPEDEVVSSSDEESDAPSESDQENGG